MNQHQLADLLIAAARMAGNIQRPLVGQPIHSEQKTASPLSIVTEADIKTERALRAFFATFLPDYTIFGEEEGVGDSPESGNIGNGKVILIDPVDGTLNFKELGSGFGPLIGIYENGICIAGAEYDVMDDLLFVGTRNGEIEHFGKPEGSLTGAYTQPDRPTVAIGGGNAPLGITDFRSYVSSLVLRAWGPDVAIKHRIDVLTPQHAMHGHYLAYFNPTMARHDLAATPVFAHLTGASLIDHRGRLYEPLDPELEERIYASGDQTALLSCPGIIAKDQHNLDKMLWVAEFFQKEMDEAAKVRRHSV